MYDQKLYEAFVQLRKQFYKIRTRKGSDKYHNIEGNVKKFKTFKRFSSQCEDHINSKYIHEPSDETIQEIFDEMLDLSQKRILKFYIY